MILGLELSVVGVGVRVQLGRTQWLQSTTVRMPSPYRKMESGKGTQEEVALGSGSGSGRVRK